MPTVLIVDDTPGQLNMLKRAVARVPGGPHCIEATSAEEAIEIIKTGDVDVVLTDLCMEKDWSGIDVVKAAKTVGVDRGVPIPVIVVTRFGDEPSTEEGMKAGAFDWIDRNSSYYNSESMLKYKLEWALRYAGAVSGNLVSHR